MKIKEGFMLREVAGNYIVVPVGLKTIDFNGMINLNKTGAYLWEELSKGITFEALLDNMIEKYQVSKDIAESDLNEFIAKLKEKNILDITL